MADDDVTPTDDNTEPAPSVEEPEPPPAGEEPEPAPAGEEPEPPPAGEESEPAPEGEEPPPAASDADSSDGSSSSTSEDASDGDSGSSRRKSKSGGDSLSGSSDDSDLHGEQSIAITTDEVQSALVAAFQARNVPLDESGLEVTFPDIGLYRFTIRLSEAAMPLPKVPEDTSSLPAGSVQGAWLMVLGDVQLQDGATRVTMRVVKVETSEILQAGTGDASGTANKDAVQAAAEDALAAVTMLNTQ